MATGKKLFDVPAHQPLPPKSPPPDNNVVYALAFSPDGKQITLGNSDSRIHVFQATDGKFVRTLQGHTGAITGLAFHPGNAAPVLSSKDRGLRLWNPQNGAAPKTLDGHTAGPTASSSWRPAGHALPPRGQDRNRPHLGNLTSRADPKAKKK